jgi:ATP-dependent protease ClpP protease subunit
MASEFLPKICRPWRMEGSFCNRFSPCFAMAFAVAMVLVCARVAEAQQSDAATEFLKTTRPDASFRVQVDKFEDVDFWLIRTDGKTPSISLNIFIRGKITERTAMKVSKAVSMLREMGKIAAADMPQSSSNDWSMELLSLGGNVDAAIEIGKTLRSLDATVVVKQGGVCESACVLVLAGGTTRLMKGAWIGIHRPYFEIPTTAPTRAEVSAAMARMRDKLVSYLSAMNVDRALADDMMKVAPENIRYLTPSDLNQYGLLEHDPVAEEAAALKEASKYGLSRSEYMKRKLRIKEVCASNYSPDCAVDIFRGTR